MFKCPVIKDIEEDFQNTLLECEEITIEKLSKYSLFKKMIGRILRLFAPLM